MEYSTFIDRDRFSKVAIKDYVGMAFKDVNLERLVNRAINGERAAREEFYRRVEDLIDYLAELYSHRYINLGLEKSDLVHELFLASERCLASYDSSRGAFEYYYRAALTKQVSWAVCARYRSGQVNKEISLTALEEGASNCLVDHSQPETPYELETKIELKDIINFAGEQATSDEFRFLSLYLNGYSISAIAAKCNASRPTVSRKIKRALALLRNSKFSDSSPH